MIVLDPAGLRIEAKKKDDIYVASFPGSPEQFKGSKAQLIGAVALLKQLLPTAETAAQATAKVHETIAGIIASAASQRRVSTTKLCLKPVTVTWEQQRYVPKQSLGGFARVPLPLIKASRFLSDPEYRVLEAILFCAQGTGLLTAGKCRLGKIADVPPSHVKWYLRSLCNRQIIRPTGRILGNRAKEYELLTHPWLCDDESLLKRQDQNAQGGDNRCPPQMKDGNKNLPTTGITDVPGKGDKNAHDGDNRCPPLDEFDKTTSKTAAVEKDGDRAATAAICSDDLIREMQKRFPAHNVPAEWKRYKEYRLNFHQAGKPKPLPLTPKTFESWLKGAEIPITISKKDRQSSAVEVETKCTDQASPQFLKELEARKEKKKAIEWKNSCQPKSEK